MNKSRCYYRITEQQDGAVLLELFNSDLDRYFNELTTREDAEKTLAGLSNQVRRERWWQTNSGGSAVSSPRPLG